MPQSSEDVCMFNLPVCKIEGGKCLVFFASSFFSFEILTDQNKVLETV